MLLFLVVSAAGNASPHKKISAVSFDYPGATDTQATAITPSGEMVGRFTDAEGVVHGFLYSDRRYTSIDVPGAVYTEANWINPRGEIGGDYGDDSGNFHGFVLKRGHITTVDYPGSMSSSVLGISASGDLVGTWIDDDNNFHGYVEDEGKFIPVDYPGAAETLATMSADGILVGGYFDDTGAHGFEFRHGAFKSIDCPGATFTFLSGVDAEGNMVGQFGQVDGSSHGALIKDGNCIKVDYPKGIDTYLNGSDAGGDIVGRYTDASAMTHGFLLRHYIETATPVYSAGAGFSATANPNAAWSYGYAYKPSGPFEPYTISGSTYLSGEVGWFGPIAGCCAPGYPLVVAEPGVVPGYLDLGPGPSSYTIVRWTAPDSGVWDVVGSFAGTGITTADVHVLHNGKQLFKSPVNGSSVAKFSLDVKVKRGDTVDFAAGPGPKGDNGGDPTGFTATITPER